MLERLEALGEKWAGMDLSIAALAGSKTMEEFSESVEGIATLVRDSVHELMQVDPNDIENRTNVLLIERRLREVVITIRIRLQQGCADEPQVDLHYETARSVACLYAHSLSLTVAADDLLAWERKASLDAIHNVKKPCRKKT